jgi:hypothetical protein
MKLLNPNTGYTRHDRSWKKEREKVTTQS